MIDPAIFPTTQPIDHAESGFSGRSASNTLVKRIAAARFIVGRLLRSRPAWELDSRVVVGSAAAHLNSGAGPQAPGCEVAPRRHGSRGADHIRARRMFLAQ